MRRTIIQKIRLLHVNPPDDCPTLHFPAECSNCKQVAGMPTRARTFSTGGVLVELRCRECGHEWECHLPATGLPENRRKEDRRQDEGG